MKVVVGPIKLAFGFHILAVDEIIAGGDASFEDVKGALAATLRASKRLTLYMSVPMLLKMNWVAVLLCQGRLSRWRDSDVSVAD